LLNSNVSLSVLVGEVGFELIGKIKYFFKGKFFEKIKNISQNKGCPYKGVIIISVEKIVRMA
jgi:hypothetical protein